MHRSAAFSALLAALNAPARGLLFAGFLSCAVGCNDHDGGQAPPGASHGGGPSAGQGGAEQAAGKGGSTAQGAGEGGAEQVAGEGGMGGSGEPDAGAGAGGPIQGLCSSDSDCDDGLYCNGVELCRSLSEGSDAKVCMGPERGPCVPSACDETADKCDCSNPDRDHDGVPLKACATHGPYDCDDDDSNRFEGNPEVCDDQQHDEDCREETFGSKDADGDLAFAQSCANKSFYQPLFFTPSKPLSIGGSDCDDDDPATNPGAVEVCDKRDNNCNGEIDEVAGGQGDPHTYYRDQDGDYWGSEPKDTLCNFPPLGYSTLKGDCNDTNPRINPGREEICNGLDDDCNGTIDQAEKTGDLIFGQPYDGVTEFECKGQDGWTVKACPEGRLDCGSHSYLDACETIGTTLCNCHECGTTCQFSCGAAACEEIAAISTGNLHTCAIFQSAGSPSGGTVACWGRNLSGQLGLGGTKDSPRAVKVPDLTNVTAIASGELHSCAINFGGRLLCWGSNKYGQLGTGSQEAFVPNPVDVYQSSTALKAKQVSSGSFHSCAIFEDGRLACWGQGEAGQLGNDDDTNVRIPVRVQRIVNNLPQFVNDASQVVAGYQHTCALSAGRVECWGDNSSQQLGIDPEVLGSSPVARAVPGLDMHVDELSASAYHTCARAGADVYCWGSNSDGELALSSGDSAPPTKIVLPIAADSIATGSYFGCALSKAGTVYCWGSNYFGERGTPDESPGVQPTPIPLSNVTGIFGGRGSHVCASIRDDGARCWGNNHFGALGNGGTSLQPQPIPSRILPLSGTQACVSP